jgi:hypothetical protein
MKSREDLIALPAFVFTAYHALRSTARSPAQAPRLDASASVPRKPTSTGARRTELTNAMPAKIAQLKVEREDLQKRLEENGNAMHRVTNEEVAARRVVDDLKK